VVAGPGRQRRSRRQLRRHLRAGADCSPRVQHQPRADCHNGMDFFLSVSMLRLPSPQSLAKFAVSGHCRAGKLARVGFYPPIRRLMEQ